MNPLPPTRSRALSLKARVALVMTLLFIVAVAFVTVAQLQEIRRSMYDVLAAQQDSLVARVADEIDEKFRLRQEALIGSATRIGNSLFESNRQAQFELSSQAALPTMFDHVFIFSIGGEVLANVPYEEEFARFNVTQRQYFQDTLATRRSVISAPYRSLVNGKPYVMMTAPILDPDGKLIGVLGAATSLLDSSFLGDIGATKVGHSGYFYVIGGGNRPVIISHPDRASILKPAGADRTRSSALALNGAEGTVEANSGTGAQAVMTFKRLKRIDWVLGAVLPSEEAFGPIGRAQERIVVLAGLVAVLLGGVTWALAYWLLLPLESLRAYVRARRQGTQQTPALPVHRWDEIGVLTDAFNDLMHIQQEAKEALLANETRLRMITDNVPALIGYVDTGQRYRFVNRAYEEWFGRPSETFIGNTMREMQGEAIYAQIREQVEQVLQGYIVSQEWELKLHDRTRHVRAMFMPDYGSASQVLGFYVLTHDVTDQKLAQARLAFLAHHDPLTEVPNRAAFAERLELALRRAQRSHKPFALMYLDIDRFKSINDTHGHGVGDQLLKAFATRLRESVRATDVVGRIGGDEFVVLAEDLGAPADAGSIAGKIVAAMRQPFLSGGLQLRATTSVGVAICHEDCETVSANVLLERADRALYQAKLGGRDAFCIDGLELLSDAPAGAARATDTSGALV